MGSQQERSPKIENNIAYDFKATQALEFARERARTEGRKVVTFKHLIEGVNNQIPPQEKPNIYKAYGIEEFDIKLISGITVAVEYLELDLLEQVHRTATELQFSPRAQRAVHYAELIATLKQNQTLDVYDLFRGAAKVAGEERAAQQTLFQNSTL